MKSKKFIAIALLLLMAVNNSVFAEVVAAESTQQIAGEESFLMLSLVESIDYALMNSKEMELQRLELSKSEVQYDQNRKAVRSLQDFYDLDINVPRTYEITAEDNINRAMIKNGASLRQVELAWDIANWNLAKKENSIKYNVEKAYFDLKKAEAELIISAENLALSQKQYEFAKLRYGVGLISKQQLLGMELNMAQAQSGYDASSMLYSIQEMSFKTTLGIPLDRGVKLTDTVDVNPYEPIDIEYSVQLALDNNTNLMIASESYEIQKLVLKATSGRFPPVTFRYREKEAEVAKAKVTLLTVKNAVEMGVRTAYLNLATAEKQITTFKLAVRQAEEALRISELSYELGQNTSSEVNQASINLMNAKKSLAGQIHAYNLALLDFEYSIGIGK